MNAAIAGNLIGTMEIGNEIIGSECQFYDRIVEVDSADDSMTFVIIDCFVTLLVYLSPVVAFGYLVAPVVARLLRMPVPD